MKESPSVLEGIMAGFQGMMGQVTAYLPRVAVAVLVLILGWLLAKVLRLLIVKTAGRLDHLWQRFIAKPGLGYLQPRHPPARIVGELVFWLILLVFVTIATDILGLSVFGDWLKEIVTYLPLAATGLLIVLVGFVVGSLVRDLVASAAATAGLSHGDLLGRTAQLIILFTAIIIGVDQIGIDVVFISVVAAIILATTLGGIALAFGLGARTHVSNIIAANQLRQLYQVGDLVRLGEVQGRITGISLSRVSLETEEGSVDIPARLFDEQATLLMEQGG
jgi:small-conductance mechanosensitive channel